MMIGEAGATVALGLVKVVIGVYDVITLPVYFFIQQPWKKWRLKRAIWATPLVKGDPSSPYVRLKGIQKEIFPDKLTIDQMFRTAVKQFRGRPCFGTREVFDEEDHVQPDGTVLKKLIMGDLKWMTFQEAGDEVEKVARSLVSIGIKPKEPIVLFAETRKEWMIVAQAVFRLGGQVATLYATLGESGIVHGINETGVSVVVTSCSLLPKLQKLMPQIPSVKHIVYMEGPRSPSLTEFPKHVKIMSYSQFVHLSDGLPDSAEIRYEAPRPHDVAVIMYTSGSTGTPKGVLITHDNLLVIVRTFHIVTEQLGDLSKVHFIGYLPLAHLFELAAELVAISVGVQIGYSSPQTLIDKSSAIKEGQKGDIALIQPDLMIAVPLLLDRILKSVYEVTASKGLFFKRFFHHAVRYKIFWTNYGFATPLLDRLVFGKIRNLLGGKLKFIATGGAALSPDTQRFTAACLGVTLFQGYGMTESGGAGTMMDLDDANIGTVGPPSVRTLIRLINWEEGGYHVTDTPHPRGEILIGGPSISPGYYKNEALTNETFFNDEKGIRWCRTGDIGEIIRDGTLKIVDRKKDLVKLQHGEYVSMSKIEALLKTHLLVENICVYGSALSTYIVALVIPNKKQLRIIAENLGKLVDKLSFENLCNDQDVTAAATSLIKKHAVKCHLHRIEIPSKIKLCKEEWLPESGLVTATFKIKRAAVYKFYHDDIQKLYGTVEMNGTSKHLR